MDKVLIEVGSKPYDVWIDEDVLESLQKFNITSKKYNNIRVLPIPLNVTSGEVRWCGSMCFKHSFQSQRVDYSLVRMIVGAPLKGYKINYKDKNKLNLCKDNLEVVSC